VEEQQVGLEVVAGNIEVHLPANEREPLPELAEGVNYAVHEDLLEVAFLCVPVEGEEVQHVRVLRDLLRQIRLPRWEDVGEVRRRRLQPRVRCGADLVLEHVSRPTVCSRLAGVPVAELVVIEPVKQDRDVSPRELSNSLLDNCVRRPLPRESAHVEQVRAGEPFHLRKLCTQIRRETTDDVTAPPLITLALQDGRADPPVETDELRVHAALRGEPGGANLLLQFGKSGGIPGYGWRRVRHHYSVCPTTMREEPDHHAGRRSNKALSGICYARVDLIPRAKGGLLMAQKVTTHLVDDLTGDTIEEGKGRTVAFGFDGTHYEIDLTDDNADALREALSDYVAAARKVSGRSGRTSAGNGPKRGNSEDLARIREWANANGHEVSSRGRISQAVRDAYDAAH
jgi:hypothetical protein